MLLLDGLFYGPDCGLLFLVGVDIVPVEVLGEGVEAVVASVNTVRVEDGDYFENEFSSEKESLLTLFS